MAPKCRICDEDYNNQDRQPLSLPCGHTFCKSCVNRLLSRDTLKCPTCRKVHNVPAGEEPFPVNYAILEASITTTVDEVQEQDVPEDVVTLIIRDLRDQTFRLRVPLNATIKEVKEVLQRNHGFVPQNTRLLFRGRRLEDHKTITAYGIQTGNIVQLTTAYLGGGSTSIPVTATTASTSGSSTTC